MNSFFSEYAISFLLIYFLNKIQKILVVISRNSIVNTKDKKVYMIAKNLSEETEQKIVNCNPIEVITFLDPHRLAILLKIYL